MGCCERLARRPTAVAGLLAVAYAVLLVPLTSQVTRWRGDERLYTDAAIQMIEEGDWLTTRYDDGSLRFRKPGMTYWAIRVSYALFGVGLIPSRLPSVLAGALTVALTFLMGRRVYGRARPALAGAAIMASAATTFKLSTRATPDMLQCLFITISLYGFVGVLFGGRRDHLSLVVAWGGAALAFATKGFTGLLPVAFALAWCTFSRGEGPRVRDLISVRALIVAVPLAGLWYLLVFVRHGEVALVEFFRDQIGDRLTAGRSNPLTNLLRYPFGFIGNLLPWSALACIALAADRRGAHLFWIRHRRFVLFAAIWLAALILIFSAGNIMRVRYLAPAYPMVSVVLGGFLANLTATERGPGSRRWHGWLRALHVPAALAMLTAALWAAVTAFGPMLVYATTGTVAAIAVIVARRRWPLELTAVVLLAGYAVIDVAVRPAMHPSPAPQIARHLRAMGIRGNQVAAMGSVTDLVSQIRILSRGRIDPVIVPTKAWSNEWVNYAAVIVPETCLGELAGPGWQVREDGYRLRRAHRSDVFRDLWEIGPSNTYEGMKIRYYIGMAPREAGTPGRPEDECGQPRDQQLDGQSRERDTPPIPGNVNLRRALPSNAR